MKTLPMTELLTQGMDLENMGKDIENQVNLIVLVKHIESLL